MQVDPLKPTLKAPGTQRLKVNMINCFQFCLNFAFKYNLRRYTMAEAAAASAGSEQRSGHRSDTSAGHPGHGGRSGPGHAQVGRWCKLKPLETRVESA